MSEERFRELREHELSALTDEQLIDYIVQARGLGLFDPMTVAIRVLAFGYWQIILARVALKVPPEDVEEVASAALESALEVAFEGSSTGEFKALLHTIIQRRIADYHRHKEGKPGLVPLPDPGDEEIWGEEPAVDPDHDVIGVEQIVEQALSEMNDVHRECIELNVFADLSAGEVAKRLGLSDQNVHKIKERFKTRLRELLDESDTSG